MTQGRERAERGRRASATGFANESRFLGALLARDYNASKVDLPHSTYDIVVELANDIIRVQVKTVGSAGSVSFTGGTRGGVDRISATGVKRYVQNTETSDIVVGVEARQSNGEAQVDFYFIPTLFIERLGQGSLSVNRIPASKNRWDLLDRCKDREFVYGFFHNLLGSS